MPLAARTVFADLNQNMRLDAGEPVAVSDTSGQYVLQDLPEGTVTEREVRLLQVLPEGWSQTQPSPALPFRDVYVHSGGYLGMDFGSFGSGPPLLSATFDTSEAPHALRVSADRALSSVPRVEDFAVERVADGAPVAVALEYDPASYGMTLTFPEIPNGLLSSGRYRLMVTGGGASGLPGYTFEFTHLAGDANDDGTINADDYFRIDSGFMAQPEGPSYEQGDFNHDDVINADDYFLIDSTFLIQGTILEAGGDPATNRASLFSTASITTVARERARAPVISEAPMRWRERAVRSPRRA